MMSTSSVATFIELDGSLNHYANRRLEAVDHIGAVKGPKWLVTDMQDAICRTMTVNAAPRYAEVVVRKRMQETGEFEENVAILPHWKKKKDANTTDICFTALPLRLLSHYRDLGRQSEDILLVFPLYGVLLNTLRRIQPEAPSALVFQHGRFADLIIGTRRKVLYANRCVAFDASSEQITALWNTVKADMTAVEQEHHIEINRVYMLTWVGDHRSPPEPFDDRKEIYRIEEEPVDCNGRIQPLSFARVVKMTPVRSSVSAPVDRMCYHARRSMPYFNIVFLLAAFLLTGAFFYFRHQANHLEQLSGQMAQAVTRIQFDLPQDADQVRVEKTLRFIDEISTNVRTPSYKRLINDLSHSVAGNMTVDVLKVDYESGRLTMELFGRIDAPFKSAYQGYRQMIQSLQRRGYGIEKNQFDTDINSSRFRLIVSKNRL